jgi:hypothetical protein
MEQAETTVSFRNSCLTRSEAASPANFGINRFRLGALGAPWSAKVLLKCGEADIVTLMFPRLETVLGPLEP